jgi:hypothetical protein
LGSLYLNAPPGGILGIKSFVGWRHQIEPEGIRNKAFTDAADHVTIRREMPSREYLLKFSHDTV